MGVAFIMPAFVWFFIPGLILFLLLTRSEEKLNTLFWKGLVVGTVFHICVVSWFWTAYPVTTLVESPMLVQYFVIGIYSLITALSLAVGPALFAVGVHILADRFDVFLFGGALLWVASEAIGAFFFSLMSWGPGSILNINFSFGHAGYLLAQNESLLHFARLCGVYGLSYLVAVVSIFIYLYVVKKKYKSIMFNVSLLCLILFGILLILFVEQTYEKTNERVLVIETYFNKELTSEPDGSVAKNVAIQKALKRAFKEDVDTIILPEDSRFTTSFSSSSAAVLWIKEQGGFKGNIVDSGRTFDERGKTVQRVHIYDGQTESFFVFDKSYMVPQGEYLAYAYGAVLSLFMSDDAFLNMEENLAYRRGDVHDSALLPKYLPGVLFCSESVSPYGVFNATKARHPSFVAHVISHSWFTNPQTMWYQLDNMLRVQSVWNQVPIVSAGNMSESKLYLPTGTIETGSLLEKHPLWSLKLFVL